MNGVRFGQLRMWTPTRLLFLVDRPGEPDRRIVVDEYGIKRAPSEGMIELLSEPWEEGRTRQFVAHDAVEFRIPNDGRIWFNNGLALQPGSQIFFHRDGEDEFWTAEINASIDFKGMRSIVLEPEFMFPCRGEMM